MEDNKLISERAVDYVIKDSNFQDFKVMKTANGWWMDRVKVNSLIECFKVGYTIKEACIFTGISQEQWQYFNEIHPDFYLVKEACELLIGMLAEKKNYELIKEKDPQQVRWYLERRKPEKYGKAQGGDAPVLNNFGTIINTPMPRGEIDAETLKVIEAEAHAE